MPGEFFRPEYVPDAAALARGLHLEPGSEEEAAFLALLDRAARAARPRAACRAGTVPAMPQGEYLFVATCGEDLERLAEGPGVLERFWFEAIMRDALVAAEEAARCFVAGCFDHEDPRPHFAMIGPGSLPEWPLEGQAELFALLAEEAAFCGIRLDGNSIMHPLKSSSGVFARVDAEWDLCGVCGRVECGERRRK